MKRLSIAALIVAGSSLAALSGAQLINQNDAAGLWETPPLAYTSQNFDAAFSSFSTIAVDDFTTTQGYSLTSFSFGLSMFGNASATEAGVTGFHVEIFKNTGNPVVSLTGDQAEINFNNLILGTGPGVNVSLVGYAGYAQGYEVTLTLPAVQLPAGSYWIGVLADNNFNLNGQTGIMGSTQATINPLNAWQVNPGGGFGFTNNESNTNPLSNLSYTLVGTPAPEPVSLAFLGLGAVGLLARRRNR